MTMWSPQAISDFLLTTGWVIFFSISAKMQREFSLQLKNKYEFEKQIENNDIYTKTQASTLSYSIPSAAWALKSISFGEGGSLLSQQISWRAGNCQQWQQQYMKLLLNSSYLQYTSNCKSSNVEAVWTRWAPVVLSVVENGHKLEMNI